MAGRQSAAFQWRHWAEISWLAVWNSYELLGTYFNTTVERLQRIMPLTGKTSQLPHDRRPAILDALRGGSLSSGDWGRDAFLPTSANALNRQQKCVQIHGSIIASWSDSLDQTMRSIIEFTTLQVPMPFATTHVELRKSFATRGE